jgi:signal transduction histidine kinase/NO-binding membrane sensor protein with MHYT domain/DNA-binding NarL/FixJ family response regulator
MPMDSMVVGHYNLGLVCLSLGIAVLASYTTLNLGNHILAATGWRRWAWIGVGALAMGTGIWATHFVAMLAFEMAMPVGYDLGMTGLSLLYAVAAAAVALALVGRPEVGWLGLAAGGSALGVAIAGMHYTGMGAMAMAAHIHYRWPLVALSVAIAVGASTAAMGLTLWGRRTGARPPWAGNLAVFVLGLGIGGLHYTAMAGTLFISVPVMPVLPHETLLTTMPDLDARWLALAVALGASVILVITLIGLRLNQRLTEKRLQEEALAKSEQRFRTLIREMGVGVLMLNAQAEILISNQAARDFLHLPELGDSPVRFGQFGQFCQEDGSPIALADLPVQRAIAQKAALDDLVISISFGEADPVRWLLVNVDPQLNDAGVVERVVCTCSDITIQKQAEAAVRAVADREIAVMRIVQRMRQTLDLEEIFAATTQELQQAVSCDRVWIYRFNPDWSGTVVAETLTDPAALSTLAATTDQTLIDRADCGAREMREGGFDDGYLLVEDTYLQETQAETYRQDRTYHRVNDIYAEGFDHCYLEFLEQWQVRAYVIVPIFAGSQLWGLLGVYHHQPRVWNRHEVKMVLQVGAHLGTAVQQANLLRQTQQQAEALEIAKQAADAASQAKGDFLASMSHELRTPLNAILGFTQILHDDESLAAEHRDLITIVNRSGSHLLGLINNVLSLAKIEANKITLDERAFDLHGMLDAVDDMLQLKAEAKGLRLEVVPPPPLAHTLKADEGKLRQILINLIGNAIKFTPQGSVTVRTRLHGPLPQREPGGHPAKRYRLEIAVQDTGVGMATAELARLFQPFEQTQSGRHAAEGTGLGLSLSYNFAQLMGGTITVSSAPGEGTTFVVSIPVGTAAAIAPARPSAVETISHLVPDQPTPRILVADDVAESRLLLRHWLEGAGFEVAEASNGQEAVDQWVAWQPHLICLDMRMPVLDGYGVARQIRQRPGGDVPVILAVTASVFEEQQSDCLGAGCNGVLPKPLQRQVLLEYIGRSLGLAYQYLPALEGDSDGAVSATVVDHRPLTRADLSTLAPAWLAQLHQAAQAADDRRVQQLIAELPAEHRGLADRLERLIHHFRLDVIIDLTATSLTPVSL